MINPPECAATDAQFFSLSGLLPADISRSRAAQARSVFERMEAALQDEGMTFAHVIRTWFHLDAILDWYDEFNAVRNKFFKERNVFDGIVPASTGVGIPNPHGAALVAGLLAVKPRSSRVKVFAVPSPLQCPALEYGSSFNRAVEVHVPGRRHLYISGTASIDRDGHSAHAGDVRGQIELTMNVVRAILASRRMDFANATRVAAYIRHTHDAPVFDAWLADHGLQAWPVSIAPATICRAELHFEIELDAVSPAP
jgi:enamine deaminase RidA (YjgF/YER057c/UK114 family)